MADKATHSRRTIMVVKVGFLLALQLNQTTLRLVATVLDKDHPTTVIPMEEVLGQGVLQTTHQRLLEMETATAMESTMEMQMAAETVMGTATATESLSLSQSLLQLKVRAQRPWL